ncbi:hypothetical protein JM18_009527 [Phytophthora kernoviae]|uniref:ABC transporter domain-containing protein n=1 Tax=Phytophthora kernoviae TaxID=325452 RepID=A0A921S7Z3_9STRA|nr:hypothetical protein JM18_009527 [Phytophthora kernoviae]
MTGITWAEIVDYIPAPPTPESQVSTIDSEDATNQPFSRQTNPLEHASLPSIVLAHWMQPMVSVGAHRVLELKDMWPIGQSDSCDSLESRFRAVYDPNPQIFDISPVAMAFTKTFRRELTSVFIGSVLYVVALAMQSYVAQALLQFLSDKENLFHISNGYWLVAMMTISSLVAVCTVNYVFFTTSRIGANIRSLTMVLVFDKALKLSSAARQEYTAGEILTLMSVDAERVFMAMLQSPWHVMGPLAFVVSIVMIGVLLDAYSALVGMVVLVVVMYISVKQGDRIARLQRMLLEVIEQRVKVTSEALQGIRVMKFYAWEEPLAQRVEKLRTREVSFLRKFHTFQVVNTVMLFLTPTFLSGATLGLYVLLHDTIDVVETFTLIAMVNICRTALFQLPQAISSFCKAKISLSRIDVFLVSDEFVTGYPLLSSTMPNDSMPMTPSSLLSDDYKAETWVISQGCISFREACFQWPRVFHATNLVVVTPAHTENQGSLLLKASSSECVSLSCDFKSDILSAEASSGRIDNTKEEIFRLEGLNLEVDRGSLVMIVGKVGSGKSSLVNAILGEMPRTSGVLEVGGRIAYVSQDTWIRNATLRDNILFEQNYDADRYAQVLDASQLAMDLRALPNGDDTEIGERGINLSGGQKARVAIARAMYRLETDVLILDDPLSAVDPHVAHAIFEKCIVGLAAGQTRLLVLNSHYNLLPNADHIVVMQDGMVIMLTLIFETN